METNRDLPLQEATPRWAHGLVLIMTLGFALLVSNAFLSPARAQDTHGPKSAKSQHAPLPQSPFKVVANVQQVMTVLTIPASDVVFGAVVDTPRTDSTWQTIQNNALVLAESGNLLTMPGRARDDQEWVMRSHAMIEAAIGAFNAAVAKDADKLAAASDKIYSTCESCHQKYMAK